MTGSGLAQLIIPITGTLFLTAWLAVIQIPAPARAQDDLLAASTDAGNLRVAVEVER